MGVVLARAGRLAARANQNPPSAPAPGPAPPRPAPFRISANLSTLGSPRAWAAAGWAGLTVLRGGPAPPGRAARCRLPPPPAQLPPKIPRGSAALGWLQRAPSHRLHPQLESPELPATSATEPREPRRAPPLQSTGARSLALHQTMGTPEEPRPPDRGSRGTAQAPIVSTIAPTAGRAPSSPSRVPGEQGQKPRLRPSLTQKTNAPRPPARQVSGPLPLQRLPLAARRLPGRSLARRLRSLRQASTHLLAPSRLATL